MADQEQYFQPLADLLRLATETVSAKKAEERFLSGTRDARIPARGLLDGNPGRIEPEWWLVMHSNSLLAEGVVWFDREKAIYLSSFPPFRAEQIEVEENAFCKVLGLPLRTELNAESRSRGGSRPKYHAGLQQFINRLAVEFKDAEKLLTPPTLKAWLLKNANPGEGYDPTPEILDCDDIEFYGSELLWKDHTGSQKSIVIRSVDPYISRAVEAAEAEVVAKKDADEQADV